MSTQSSKTSRLRAPDPNVATQVLGGARRSRMGAPPAPLAGIQTVVSNVVTTTDEKWYADLTNRAVHNVVQPPVLGDQRSEPLRWLDVATVVTLVDPRSTILTSLLSHWITPTTIRYSYHATSATTEQIPAQRIAADVQGIQTLADRAALNDLLKKRSAMVLREMVKLQEMGIVDPVCVAAELDIRCPYALLILSEDNQLRAATNAWKQMTIEERVEYARLGVLATGQNDLGYVESSLCHALHPLELLLESQLSVNTARYRLRTLVLVPYVLASDRWLYKASHLVIARGHYWQRAMQTETDTWYIVSPSAHVQCAHRLRPSTLWWKTVRAGQIETIDLATHACIPHELIGLILEWVECHCMFCLGMHQSKSTSHDFDAATARRYGLSGSNELNDAQFSRTRQNQREARGRVRETRPSYFKYLTRHVANESSKVKRNEPSAADENKHDPLAKSVTMVGEDTLPGTDDNDDDPQSDVLYVPPLYDNDTQSNDDENAPSRTSAPASHENSMLSFHNGLTSAIQQSMPNQHTLSLTSDRTTPRTEEWGLSQSYNRDAPLAESALRTRKKSRLVPPSTNLMRVNEMAKPATAVTRASVLKQTRDNWQALDTRGRNSTSKDDHTSRRWKCQTHRRSEQKTCTAAVDRHDLRPLCWEHGLLAQPGAPVAFGSDYPFGCDHLKCKELDRKSFDDEWNAPGDDQCTCKTCAMNSATNWVRNSRTATILSSPYVTRNPTTTLQIVDAVLSHWQEPQLQQHSMVNSVEAKQAPRPVIVFDWREGNKMPNEKLAIDWAAIYPGVVSIVSEFRPGTVASYRQFRTQRRKEVLAACQTSAATSTPIDQLCELQTVVFFEHDESRSIDEVAKWRDEKNCDVEQSHHALERVSELRTLYEDANQLRLRLLVVVPYAHSSTSDLQSVDILVTPSMFTREAVPRTAHWDISVHKPNIWLSELSNDASNSAGTYTFRRLYPPEFLSSWKNVVRTWIHHIFARDTSLVPPLVDIILCYIRGCCCLFCVDTDTHALFTVVDRIDDTHSVTMVANSRSRCT